MRMHFKNAPSGSFYSIAGTEPGTFWSYRTHVANGMADAKVWAKLRGAPSATGGEHLSWSGGGRRDNWYDINPDGGNITGAPGTPYAGLVADADGYVNVADAGGGALVPVGSSGLVPSGGGLLGGGIDLDTVAEVLSDVLPALGETDAVPAFAPGEHDKNARNLMKWLSDVTAGYRANEMMRLVAEGVRFFFARQPAALDAASLKRAIPLLKAAFKSLPGIPVAPPASAASGGDEKNLGLYLKECEDYRRTLRQIDAAAVVIKAFT